MKTKLNLFWFRHNARSFICTHFWPCIKHDFEISVLPSRTNELNLVSRQKPPTFFTKQPNVVARPAIRGRNRKISPPPKFKFSCWVLYKLQSFCPTPKIGQKQLTNILSSLKISADCGLGCCTHLVWSWNCKRNRNVLDRLGRHIVDKILQFLYYIFIQVSLETK